MRSRRAPANAVATASRLRAFARRLLSLICISLCLGISGSSRQASGFPLLSPFPLLPTLGQEMLGPDDPIEPLPLPEGAAEPGSADQDVAMTLPARPIKTTEARPGDWFDVDENGQVSEVLRRHWVRLDGDGRLRGKISTLQNDMLVPSPQLSVHFIQRGEIIASTTTDSDGKFETDPLRPGVYCMIARGPRGFLAYSVNVVRADARQARVIDDDGHIRFVQLGGVRGTLDIDSVAVPPTFRTVRNLIRQYNFLDEDESRLLPMAEQEAAPDAAPQLPAPPKQPGLEEQAGLNAKPGTTISQHVVYLNPEGRLIGKLTSVDFDTGRPKAIEQVTVHIIRNDRPAGRAAVQPNGVFEVAGLQPGSYSLVATGRGGFGAIGFELRERDQQVRRRREVDDVFQFAVDRRESSTQLVQDFAPAGNNMGFPISIALIDDPRNLRAGLDPNAGQGADAAALGGAAPGGFPGGAAGGFAGASGLAASGSGSGGGGFAGGGGVGAGLGAALGAAGLAAGVTSLATRNNNQPENRMMSAFMIDPPMTPVMQPVMEPVDNGSPGFDEL